MFLSIFKEENGILETDNRNERISKFADKGMNGNAQRGKEIFSGTNPLNINRVGQFKLQNQQDRPVRFPNNDFEHTPGAVTHRQPYIKSKDPSNIYRAPLNHYDSSNFPISTAKTFPGFQNKMHSPLSKHYGQISYPIQRTNNLDISIGKPRTTGVQFIDQINKERRFQTLKQSPGYMNGYYAEPWYIPSQMWDNSIDQARYFAKNRNHVYKYIGKRRYLVNGHPSPVRIPASVNQYNSFYKTQMTNKPKRWWISREKTIWKTPYYYSKIQMKNKPKWRWTSGGQLLWKKPHNYGAIDTGQMYTIPNYGGYKRYKTYNKLYFKNWCKYNIRARNFFNY